MSNSPKGTWLSRIGTWTAGAGLLLLAISGAHKQGLPVSWQMALGAFALGSLLMILAFVTAGVGLLRSRGTAGAASRPATWLAFLAALLVTGNSVNVMRGMRGVPPIHDITTDTTNPPMFKDVIPVREADKAANPPTYAGGDVAAAQLKAYPDIKTIVIQAPADQVFANAEATAKAMGWQIVAAVPNEGRIEATATTGWIGFKDDVVIRVVGAGAETQVDVRSKSRVGRSDIGMNARRIRAFRDRLTSS